MANVKTLKPGQNDADYAEFIFPAGSNLTLKKTMEVKDGAAIKAQGMISGQIKNVLRENDPIEFEKGGNTSPVDFITIAEQTGDIIFSTQASIYKITSMDNESKDKKVILDYLRKGVVNFNQKIPQGFVDGGRRTEFHVTDTGEAVPVSLNREVIVVDESKDEKLAKLIEEAKQETANLNTDIDKIVALSKKVNKYLGGKDVGNIVDLTEKNIAELKNPNGQIQIGDLNYGVCRHRAILFKKLADECGVGSRLVRGDYYEEDKGGGHAWNVVHVEGRYYVVDVMHDPNRLYPEDSKKAQNYMRKSSKGKKGGMGGQSVMMNKEDLAA